MIQIATMHGRQAIVLWLQAGGPPPLDVLRQASGGVFLGRGRLVDLHTRAWIELVHDGDPDCPDWVSDVTLGWFPRGVSESEETLRFSTDWALTPRVPGTMILQGNFCHKA